MKVDVGRDADGGGLVQVACGPRSVVTKAKCIVNLNIPLLMARSTGHKFSGTSHIHPTFSRVRWLHTPVGTQRSPVSSDGR